MSTTQRRVRQPRLVVRFLVTLATVAATSCSTDSEIATSRAALSDASTDASVDAHVFAAADCPAGYNIIEGTSGNDTLTGTSGSDCIIGYGGNDTISGGNGVDYLVGGTGDDTIHGGAGDDTILGNDGADILNGNVGADVIHGGRGNNTIDGGDGNDTITALDGNDVILGGVGADSIQAGEGTNTVHGGDGNDTITTGAGNDVVTGGVGADVITTGAGNDSIDGGDGNDTINAGEGDDTIVAGVGADTVHGGSGDDVIGGGDGNDTLYGDDGNDVISGGIGADAISGGAGNDVIEGGAGTNTIDGGVGIDGCVGTACEATVPATCSATVACTGGRQCATAAGLCVSCLSDSACSDSNTCTIDACVPATGCTHTAGSNGATDTTCNGVDEDCDGALDESYVATATTCGVGACASTGTRTCVSGAPNDSCTPGAPSSDADCDAVDDDCDGANDESYATVATACGVGACAAVGGTSCVNGAVLSSCVAGTPASTDTTCDNVDDDCDGVVDEAAQCNQALVGSPCVLDDECAALGPAALCLTEEAVGVIGGYCTLSCAPTDLDGGLEPQSICPTGSFCAGDFCLAQCESGQCALPLQSCIDIGYPDRICLPLCTSHEECGPGRMCQAPGLCAPIECVSNDTTCNAWDDDCDGQVDEDVAPVPIACGPLACRSVGQQLCVGGEPSPLCPPAPECESDCEDGADNDSNGLIDCADPDCAMQRVCGAPLPGKACIDDDDCSDLGVDAICFTERNTGWPGGYCSTPCDELDPAACAEGAVCAGGLCQVACQPDLSCEDTRLSCSTSYGPRTCTPQCQEGSDCLSGTCNTPWCSCEYADSTCDGIDNDCDGAVDDDYVGPTISCGLGACLVYAHGTCVGGDQVPPACQPGTPTGSDHDCDRVDNDCDGAVDEAYVATSITCGVGACTRPGNRVCTAGGPVDQCIPGAPTNDNNCNGIDNDCDGVPDDNYVGTSTCGAGACLRTGSSTCVNGVAVPSCTPGAPPSTDDTTCNGIDDDCDGLADDDYPSSTVTCGVGACVRYGSRVCFSGVVSESCFPGSPGPNDAFCNAIDEDCDGRMDEDFPRTTLGTCTFAGVTWPLQWSCLGGVMASRCVAPTEVVCGDGVDNDIDGATDCDDSECAATLGCGPAIEDCADGIDNDYDDAADCVDSDCATSPDCVEDCHNGVDDDDDAQLDCLDAACVHDPACVADSVVGTQCATNEECPAYQYDVPVLGQITFQICQNGTPSVGGGYDPVGYCLAMCAPALGIDCPAGSICADGLCLRACDTNNECGDPALHCEPYATQSGTVDACVPHCDSDSQCADGKSCVQSLLPPSAAGSLTAGVCRTCRVDDTTCDSHDDDCDGLIDEDFGDALGFEEYTCGLGACLESGVRQCLDGALEDSGCEPQAPGYEARNGIDDDCDGAIDDPGAACVDESDCSPTAVCTSVSTNLSDPGVCTWNTCANGVRDANEEGIDCGGSCVTECLSQCPDHCIAGRRALPSIDTLYFDNLSLASWYDQTLTYMGRDGRLVMSSGHRLRFEEVNGVRAALFEGYSENWFPHSATMGAGSGAWTDLRTFNDLVPVGRLDPERSRIAPDGATQVPLLLMERGGIAPYAQVAAGRTFSVWLASPNDTPQPARLGDFGWSVGDDAEVFSHFHYDASADPTWRRFSAVGPTASWDYVQRFLTFNHALVRRDNGTRLASLRDTRLYAFGFQLEDRSFPTSYIPTTDAAASRGPQQWVFPQAVIPQWIRTGAWRVDVYPQHGSADIAEGDEYVLYGFADDVRVAMRRLDEDTTAVTFFDSADGVVAENVVTWSRDEKLTITLDMALQNLTTQRGDAAPVQTSFAHGVTIPTSAMRIGGALSGNRGAFARITEPRRTTGAFEMCDVADNVCTSECPCPAKSDCVENAQCASGLCADGICSDCGDLGACEFCDPNSLTPVSLNVGDACTEAGHPGQCISDLGGVIVCDYNQCIASRGDDCSKHLCSSDSDCGVEVCGFQNGDHFGGDNERVCWPAICEADFASNCGGIDALCGTCCTEDTGCSAGEYCVANAGPRKGLPPGHSACLPEECTDVRDFDTCGDPSDPCGLCPECPYFDVFDPIDNFCRAEGCPACQNQQGDCENDSQCASGLFCVPQLGPTFGLPEDFGVCVDHCPGSSPTPNPHFCSPQCPCTWADGGCDDDEDCQNGFICIGGVGDVSGLPESFGLCGVAPQIVDFEISTRFGDAEATFEGVWNRDGEQVDMYEADVLALTNEVTLRVVPSILFAPRVTVTRLTSGEELEIEDFDLSGGEITLGLELDYTPLYVTIHDGDRSRTYYLIINRPPLRGMTTCTYGSPDCDRCANHPSQFLADTEDLFIVLHDPRNPDNDRRIPYDPPQSGQFWYDQHEGEELPPEDWEFNGTGCLDGCDHVESISRVPGLGPNTWFVLNAGTVAAGKSTSAFYLTEIRSSAIPYHGGEIGPWIEDDPAGDVKFVFPVSGNHPGGSQTVGQVLVMPSYYDDAVGGTDVPIDTQLIRFYDLTSANGVGGSAEAPLVNTLALNGTSGEPTHLPNGVAIRPDKSETVAATRLDDGRWLVFTIANLSKGAIYVSDTADLSEARWFWVQNFNALDEDDYLPQTTTDCYKKDACVPWEKVDPQTLSFVTACDSGEIFLVAMGNSEYVFVIDDGYNRVGVNRLVEHQATEGPRVRVEHVRRANVNSDWSTFRAAASVYVDPNGDLLLYGSDHSDDVFGGDVLLIDEWRTDIYNGE